MNFKHNVQEIKGISRLGAAIASDDLKKVLHEMKDCIANLPVKKIYETILQSYLFCGFPAVIESLRIFSDLSGGYTEAAETYDSEIFAVRGEKNCKAIYRKNYDKLIENMAKYSPDLKQWMIIEGYGKVMGRPGLNLLEREFVNISILCTRYYESQLHAHIKGCLNNGATANEVMRCFRELDNVASERNIQKALELLEKINASKNVV